MRTPRFRLADRSLPSPTRAWVTFAIVALLCAGVTATVLLSGELQRGVAAPRISTVSSPVAVIVEPADHPGVPGSASGSPAPSASPAADPSASAAASPTTSQVALRLLEVRSQLTRNMPGFEGEIGDLVSFKVELTPVANLTAGDHWLRLYISGNGETGRFSPLRSKDLTPDLGSLDLDAGQTVTGWLTFFVPEGTPIDSAELVVRLDPERNQIDAQIPVEWD